MQYYLAEFIFPENLSNLIELTLSGNFAKTLQSAIGFPFHDSRISDVSLKPTNCPLLQSLRLQDVNSAEFVCTLLRDVAPQIMFMEIQPVVLDSDDSLTLYRTLCPFFKHLKALEKLGHKWKNQVKRYSKGYMEGSLNFQFGAIWRKIDGVNLIQRLIY